MFYRQCMLEKPSGQAVIRTTAWLPEEFAKVGKVVRLKEDDGWVVKGVGDRVDGERANKQSVENRKVPVDRK